MPLTTSQKAPLTVTDDNGNVINEGLHSADVFTSDADVVTTEVGNFGAVFVIAEGEGSADVTVQFDGSEGTLEVTVTGAPLTLTLGTPQPK